MELTFATYNICHCANFKDWDRKTSPLVSIEKTAEVLKDINADVVGLNEAYDDSIGREDFRKQTEKLAKLCGVNDCVFAKGKKFDWGDVIGNSILSKYKIVKVETYPVPAPTEEERNPEEKNWYEDRVIVKATIDIGREINVMSTHFGLNPLEKKRIVAKLTEILDSDDRPFVLMGDFNALPHREILQPIYDRLQSAADVMGKTNVFTWASFEPLHTLDYIFLSKEFKVVEYEVLDVIVSDHRPVYTKAVIEV